MKRISVTALRQNIFKIIDQVIGTGVPVEIERQGRILRLVPEKPESKLANLKPHDCIVGDPEELVDLKVGQWREADNV